MHIQSLIGVCLVALASTTTALPRLAGPYDGHRLAVHVPTNSTTAQNATTTRTAAKVPLTTGLPTPKNKTVNHLSHGLNSIDNPTKGSNHCNELCSLEAQTCTIAVPEDDKYCWQTYTRCMSKCRPDNFQK
ncbi:hypothetical protein N7520_009832 [Penicillium odoratum]|uniref:uncharacterized protein n=1 Tax=Penicillium odoratum TaxID=1167516 RepID=UPI0025483005|nr:uncharacterized protein N7520_009832 [Penicillium odoratum]KAJ5752915.1 hypothetical protein N7520_009832 [Penicillium odoratum]